MDKKNGFQKGDTVCVTKGTFASFLGEVVRVDDLSGRLTVEGRFEAEPDSGLQSLNVSFSIVEKMACTSNSTQDTSPKEDIS